jgi:hypothetical protein
MHTLAHHKLMKGLHTRTHTHTLHTRTHRRFFNASGTDRTIFVEQPAPHKHTHTHAHVNTLIHCTHIHTYAVSTHLAQTVSYLHICRKPCSTRKHTHTRTRIYTPCTHTHGCCFNASGTDRTIFVEDPASHTNIRTHAHQCFL